MLYGKGNSECHTYGKTGRQNHDQIVWHSSNGGKCKFRTSRGKKGNLCSFGVPTCKQKGSEPVNCPIQRYLPVGISAMSDTQITQVLSAKHSSAINHAN